MSVQAARRALLERFATTDMAVFAGHAELPTAPAFCDGVDVDGRAVLLVGAHALRQLPDGQGLRAGSATQVSPRRADPGRPRHPPRADGRGGWAEVVDGQANEVLLWGSRNSGKFVVEAVCLVSLAELHHRAGFPLPLKALWLHASLVDAAMKTAATLEEPIWRGLWQLQSDRHVAVARLGGRDICSLDVSTTTLRRMSECLTTLDLITKAIRKSRDFRSVSGPLASSATRLPTLLRSRYPRCISQRVISRYGTRTPGTSAGIAT
jgi:hypothetical protein